jgi:hypothetical protein
MDVEEVAQFMNMWMRDRKVAVQVRWVKGGESDMWLSELLNCDLVYNRFLVWIDAGCPKHTARSMQIAQQANIGERSLVHLGMAVSTPYMFSSHEKPNDCLVLAHNNAAAALHVGDRISILQLQNTKARMHAKLLNMNVLIYAMVQRNSRLHIRPKIQLMHIALQCQPLPKAGVFIGVAITQHGEYHSFAIDNTNVLCPILLDGYNESPVAYTKEALQWARSWSSLREVRLKRNQ